MSEEKLSRIRIPEMIDKTITPEQRMEILLQIKIKSDEDYRILGGLFSEEE